MCTNVPTYLHACMLKFLKLAATYHGRRLRGQQRTVPQKIEMGDGPCLCPPPNILDLRNTFYHSFIHSAISIAPLQVLYNSEALPTTARILCRSFTPKRTGNCG